MKIRHAIASAAAAITAATTLQADLVYEEGAGWTVEGGVLAPWFDSAEEAENAVDLMNQAKARQDKGNNWSALSLYKSVLRDYPNSVFAPEAHYQRSLIYTERNQFESANQELLEIITRYPNYEKFNQVVSQIFQIGEQMADGERPFYWGVIPGFRDYEVAQEVLEGVVSKAPYSDFAPLALMNVADVAQKRGREEEAIDALDRLINNYPNSIFAPDAYLELGQTFADLVQGPYYDQAATREAIMYFEDFTILYPESNNMPKAESSLFHMRDTLSKSKLLMADFFYQYRNNPRAARILYNEAITIDPQSESAAIARKKLEEINAGKLARATWYDLIFGRYQDAPEDGYLADELPEDMDESLFAPEGGDEFTPKASAN